MYLENAILGEWKILCFYKIVSNGHKVEILGYNNAVPMGLRKIDNYIPRYIQDIKNVFRKCNCRCVANFAFYKIVSIPTVETLLYNITIPIPRVETPGYEISRLDETEE